MSLTDHLIERLVDDDYKSISPQALTLDDWITLAVLLSKQEFVSLHPGVAANMIVARMQVLLVDAGLLSDTQFVNLLTQRRKEFTSSQLEH